MVDNKKNWALILGGSSGLGLATALKLSGHGYHILMVHRDRKLNLPEIENSVEEIEKKGVQCRRFNIDATHSEKQDELITEFRRLLGEQKIKVLVHSIARGNLKPMLSDEENVLTNQDFQLTLNAMAVSLYDWVLKLSKNKLLADDTRVLAFTSEGNQKAWPSYAAISAAKASLEAITRSIALEFAPIGIKANCIQAGATETPAFKMIPGSEELKKSALKRNPNNRLTKPEDVANVVYLMTLDEAKWITGTIIKVDGGESLQ